MALEKSLAFLQFLDRFMLCFIGRVGICISRRFKIRVQNPESEWAHVFPFPLSAAPPYYNDSPPCE